MACCVVGRADATSWPGNRDLLNQLQSGQPAINYFGQPEFFAGQPFGIPTQPFGTPRVNPGQPNIQPNTQINPNVPQPNRFNPGNPTAPFNPVPDQFGFNAPGASPFGFPGFRGGNPFTPFSATNPLARRAFTPANPNPAAPPAARPNPGPPSGQSAGSSKKRK